MIEDEPDDPNPEVANGNLVDGPNKKKARTRRRKSAPRGNRNPQKKDVTKPPKKVKEGNGRARRWFDLPLVMAIIAATIWSIFEAIGSLIEPIWLDIAASSLSRWLFEKISKARANSNLLVVLALLYVIPLNQMVPDDKQKLSILETLPSEINQTVCKNETVTELFNEAVSQCNNQEWCYPGKYIKEIDYLDKQYNIYGLFNNVGLNRVSVFFSPQGDIIGSDSDRAEMKKLIENMIEKLGAGKLSKSAVIVFSSRLNDPSAHDDGRTIIIEDLKRAVETRALDVEIRMIHADFANLTISDAYHLGIPPDAYSENTNLLAGAMFIVAYPCEIYTPNTGM